MNVEFVAADPAFALQLHQYRSDSITRQYNPVLQSSLEETLARLQKSSSNFNEFDTAESFFFFLKVGEEIVGNVALNNINRQMLTAEIGYGVFANARKRGIASTAVCQFTQLVFQKTPLRKLIAFVNDENEASKRVLEKAGYIKEGLLREHFLINGLPANELIYGVLRKDLLI
jgi:RimJ/RimL family protein N-acetyltransferase